MNKYSKIKNRENYVTDKLGPRSLSTNNSFNSIMKSIDKFCKNEYHVNDFDKIILDVLKMDVDQRDKSIVAVL